MATYRKDFPAAIVKPKLHILENHVIQWIQKWCMGAGVMGKQGAESIHAHLSRLEHQYSGIVNPLDRLRYVVNEHNLEASPVLNTLQPTLKKI